MRVLSRAHADEAGRRLVREMPRRVLEAVAKEEGRRETQLVSELTRWLPKSIDPGRVAGWVDEALGWLIVRGDVERSPRGVYHCVPPYLVESGDASNGGGLRLHGNPRAEADLLKILAAFDPRIMHGEVRPYKRPRREDEALPGLGVLERSIALEPADVPAAVLRCRSQGYAVLRPPELAATLPGRDGVATPAQRDLAFLGNPAAGIWETYDPAADREDRWNKAESWQSGGARLVRWRPSDDWEGDRSARIYYHGGYGQVAELGAEMGTLWQLYLDDLVGNPRVTWWNGKRFWVPKVLPAATLRWLELLSGMRARAAGPRMQLTMSEAAISVARSALSDRLGLRFRSGHPPREGVRGRRYGRGAQ